jgi:hypothetical protein
MEKRIDEIEIVHWVEDHGEEKYPVEPLREEIDEAIAERNLETRGFQKDYEALVDEWNREAGGSFEKYLSLRRQYHARRIAYFVVRGWNDPIVLHEDQCRVKEGMHRLKAAKQKGDKTICVRLDQN